MAQQTSQLFAPSIRIRKPDHMVTFPDMPAGIRSALQMLVAVRRSSNIVNLFF
jgi:hypothetical protein